MSDQYFPAIDQRGDNPFLGRADVSLTRAQLLGIVRRPLLEGQLFNVPDRYGLRQTIGERVVGALTTVTSVPGRIGDRLFSGLVESGAVSIGDMPGISDVE